VLDTIALEDLELSVVHPDGDLSPYFSPRMPEQVDDF
jgi:hypothetical protein